MFDKFKTNVGTLAQSTATEFKAIGLGLAGKGDLVRETRAGRTESDEDKGATFGSKSTGGGLSDLAADIGTHLISPTIQGKSKEEED